MQKKFQPSYQDLIGPSFFFAALFFHLFLTFFYSFFNSVFFSLSFYFLWPIENFPKQTGARLSVPLFGNLEPGSEKIWPNKSSTLGTWPNNTRHSNLYVLFFIARIRTHAWI
jgi:hypothetical protein